MRGRCTLIILLNSPQKSVQLKQCCRRSEISVVHLPHLPNYSYRRMVLTLIQGFSVEGQENIQEILSKQLYLCQFLVAISILRPGKAQIRFVYKWTYQKSTKQKSELIMCCRELHCSLALIYWLFLVLTGGHFVCKLFDLFTPFSVGLVYLMYRIFDKVSICKPVTSRPANSERFVSLKRYPYFCLLT